jgi:hypothetical protein
MDFFKLLPIRTWAYLGLAIGLSGLVTWGFVSIRSSGVADCERKHQVELAQHIERAAAQAHQIALQDAEVISWADNVRTRTIFKTLWREHETTVHADCSLTPASRVLWNRAVRAATDLSDTGIEGEPSPPVDNPGNGDNKRDGSGEHQERRSDPPDSLGAGRSPSDAQGSWFIGW